MRVNRLCAKLIRIFDEASLCLICVWDQMLYSGRVLLYGVGMDVTQTLREYAWILELSMMQFSSLRSVLISIAALHVMVFALSASLCAVAPAANAAVMNDDAKPNAISELTYTEAVARSRDDGRVLIVMGTAEWCGPCKQMDRTTWVDTRLIEWFREHGLAIKVDVDKDPELAKQLRIRAMPTMIAYRNGEEFDRVMGYRDAAGMLAWCADIKEGRTQLDRLRASAGARPVNDEGVVDTQARMELASNLELNGRLDEALDEYVWLWENMVAHEPAMVGVRNSFLVGYMKKLAERHPPALERFTRMRDDAQSHLQGEGGPTWALLEDWIGLCEVIGDQAAVLAWFDRIKERPGAEGTLRRFSHRIEPLLIHHQRYSDLALVYWDPARSLERTFFMMERIMGTHVERDGGPDPHEVRRMYQSILVREAGQGLAMAVLGEHDGAFARLLGVIDEMVQDEVMLREIIKQATYHGVERAQLRSVIERVQDEPAGTNTGALLRLLRDDAGMPDRPVGRD